jgi:hypothetical protein
LLFSKYAEFCFSLAALLEEKMNELENTSNNMHWKFFGTMLSDVLTHTENVKSGQDEVLMFTVLPFIAKGLKSSIKELQIASLMGISQISCRKTLSFDY